jgi:hypothetical protein
MQGSWRVWSRRGGWAGCAPMNPWCRGASSLVIHPGRRRTHGEQHGRNRAIRNAASTPGSKVDKRVRFHARLLVRQPGACCLVVFGHDLLSIPAYLFEACAREQNDDTSAYSGIRGGGYARNPSCPTSSTRLLQRICLPCAEHRRSFSRPTPTFRQTVRQLQTRLRFMSATRCAI